MPFEVICDVRGMILEVVLDERSEMILYQIYYGSKEFNPT